MIRALTPMAFVADVQRSIDFYKTLGFEVANTHSAPDGALVWVWLRSDRADIMLARASHPVVAEQQAVLFYVYCDDVEGTHTRFTEAGINPGPIEKPFYSPRGEFRVTDPDGYGLTFSHM